ncbi:hypothetical protein [Spirosoma montaniterrae]|uniref:Outer membrane protein beta-barrel domain-containing protein n=1 Tax=Spirosoma montaniterrae TaxID=1178516 RepID=A0A1P9WT62_9BACT|nr:hypothetical protein [Spirosoma montaniterrae]AQG78557.1 hypothetical protein AWR27_03890 [Spirosoma montaniterrae]
MLAGLVLLGFAMPSVGLAQQADTVRRDDVQSATNQAVQSTDAVRSNARDNIYRLGKGVYTDTLRREDFKAVAADVAELDDCDTTFQTFVLVRRLSPWRIGLFAGPNFAYCGTWENTFGPVRRDNSLYNGAGFNITGNVDYYLTPATRRLRFGLGTAFGYQNYITRGAYRDYLYALAASRTPSVGRDQVTIRQRASEDMFLTVGPVVQFTLARSRRNPDATTFIELGLRGGLFRTEAATIAAYIPSQLSAVPNVPSFVDGGALLRSVNPSAKLYHPGGLLSLGVFFPLRNNWNIGVQGQGFYTRLNYLIINGIQDELAEFTRKHGGFSAGVAVRKGFVQRKLIPKAPITCPTCEQIPALNIQFNGASLKGTSLAYNDNAATVNPSATAPVISWRSTTPNPRNETFTARLYYRADSVGTTTGDQVIAQLENTTDTTLAFPTAYFSNGQLNPGFYYVTVHNRQTAKCGTCMSEVATTSFAVVKKTPPLPDCKYRHRLERLEVYYRTPYTREVANVCYCNGTITSVGDTVTRLRYRGLNRRLATSVVEFDTNTVILNINELPGGLAQQLQAEKAKIESGNAIRFKGRRVRPQVSYFRAVFTVTKLPCNGQPEQQVGSFNTTISDNTYSITDLKPLTEAQRANLLNPAPVKKKPARRRAGNSGRRSDVMFGIE